MTSHMQHIFFYNSLPSLQNYGVISRFIENVTNDDKFLFVLLNVEIFLRNSTPGDWDNRA